MPLPVPKTGCNFHCSKRALPEVDAHIRRFEGLLRAIAEESAPADEIDRQDAEHDGRQHTQLRQFSKTNRRAFDEESEDS